MRNKLGQFQKGHTIGFKKGYTPWDKGKKFSEEHRKKMSESQKKITHSGRFKKGFKQSKEVIEKIRKHHRRFQSETTKKKLSEMFKGEKSYNWQGGKSFEPYSVDWTETLKRSIRERDNYICQICNQYGNEVHHIDSVKKNCSSDNLITLCKRCHAKIGHQFKKFNGSKNLYRWWR